MSWIFGLGISMSCFFSLEILMSWLFVLWKTPWNHDVVAYLSPFLDVVVFWSWNLDVVAFCSWNLDVVAFWSRCCGFLVLESRCRGFLALESRCRDFLVLESRCRGICASTASFSFSVNLLCHIINVNMWAVNYANYFVSHKLAF